MRSLNNNKVVCIPEFQAEIWDILNNLKRSGFALMFITGSSARQIPSHKKAPPFVPHGLHGLFCGFRSIHASLSFSVTLFAINPSFTVMFFQNHCFNPPTRSKKLRQRKANSKLLYITCS
jgi:hypothetical protein